MEKYLASSTFELELYNATSNSNSTQASTKGLYLIAEKSYNYECLLTIIARIRQRLISDQRKKWKRINKTVHLIEFLLKNGSFQFVIVFIEKFLHLVKPYCNYTYSEDGTDRGYAIRECSRRILELAKDRPRLKQERAESGKLRKRIQSEGSSGKGSGKKRYVIDEDAFYGNSNNDAGEDAAPTKKPAPKPYDAQPKGEVSLARRLGLQEGPEDPTQKEDKTKKKTKEELEKEKEIDEVRQIIEGDQGGLNKYIKEVDLLGIDLDVPAPAHQSGGGSNGIDLLGGPITTAPPVYNGNSAGFQGFGQPQASKPLVSWDPKTGGSNQQTDPDFGDFLSATPQK